jgi:hypothetical protein
MQTRQRAGQRQRAGLGPGILLSLLGACAAGRGPSGVAASPAAEAGGPGTSSALAVDDEVHGVSYTLPPEEGGWTGEEGSHSSRTVKVEVGSFPLALPGDAVGCRETARARLAALQRRLEQEDRPAGPAALAAHPPPAPQGDEQLADQPTPSWSFSRGSGASAIRSRWGFYARGADCLMLQVAGPLGDPAADRVFVLAARSLRLAPLPPDRQREIDLLAGMGFLERRDPASALERFDALARREPDQHRAHFGALLAAYELGPSSYARGIPHGETVLKADRALSGEQRQLALRALGVMQLTQNQIRGAAETLAELVVRAPELAEAQYNYACALARLGDAPGALDHLGTAFTLDAALRTHAREDGDLSSLHGSPAFEKLLSEPSAGQ